MNGRGAVFSFYFCISLSCFAIAKYSPSSCSRSSPEMPLPFKRASIAAMRILSASTPSSRSRRCRSASSSRTARFLSYSSGVPSNSVSAPFSIISNRFAAPFRKRRSWLTSSSVPA